MAEAALRRRMLRGLLCLPFQQQLLESALTTERAQLQQAGQQATAAPAAAWRQQPTQRQAGRKMEVWEKLLDV